MTEPTVDHVWSVAAAKARLSELIDNVEHEGPQTISRRGREVAVVVSIDEWHRKSKRSGSLAGFFAASPLRGSHLEVERDESAARDVAL